MSSKSGSVECPECGQSFDPSAAGGWCTNPECGEFQYSEAGSGPDESEGAQTDSPAAEPADTEGGTQDPESTQDPEATQEPGDTQEQEEKRECPSCGSMVPDKDFCLSCGDELPDEEETEASEPEPEPEPETPSCPSCGEEVEADWAACPHCGTSLDEDTTSGGEEADATPAATGTPADETSTADASTADRVVLEVGDTEIDAEDGDTLGRAVRSAHVRAGGDEENARYIHREHVRFEQDDDGFYLVNEGRNGTKLNGEELELDERRAISDGDEVKFADVATGTVRLE